MSSPIPESPKTLENILRSYDNNNPQKSIVKVEPKQNIKMSVYSSDSQLYKKNNGRVIKTIKCIGRLVNKDGKLVPNVECISEKIRITSKNENRNKLINEILGEVKKSKEENEVIPFSYDDHPLKYSSGCSKSKSNSKPKELSKKKTRKTRKTKKTKKRNYRNVQLNLNDNTPNIPTVNVVRKKRKNTKKNMKQ